jgi:bifunctional non-homologous end joining protein LigD
MPTPTPVITNKANLAYKSGSSDKVYNIWIENVGANYEVKFEYGRRGQTLQKGIKQPAPTHSARAKAIFDEVVDEKLGKGYKHVLSETTKTKLVQMSKAMSGTGMGVPTAATAGVKAAPTAGVAVPDPGAPVAIRYAASVSTPMLLNFVDRAQIEKLCFDDEWIFQQKHDGKRMMIACVDGDITAVNKQGKPIEPPTEFAACCKLAFHGFNFTIDGEACGETFWVFDILGLEGMACRDKPLEERLIDLGMLIRSAPHQKTIRMVYTAFTTNEKVDLFNKLEAEHREGVVAKQKTAIYTGGRPNSKGPALKFKFLASATCKVVLVNDKRSVMVAVYEKTMVTGGGTKLREIGNVTIPSNHDVPKKGDIIEVEYLYAYREGSLYQPVYKGKRDDSDVDTYDSLKFKAVDEDDSDDEDRELRLKNEAARLGKNEEVQSLQPLQPGESFHQFQADILADIQKKMGLHGLSETQRRMEVERRLQEQKLKDEMQRERDAKLAEVKYVTFPTDIRDRMTEGINKMAAEQVAESKAAEAKVRAKTLKERIMGLIHKKQ